MTVDELMADGLKTPSVPTGTMSVTDVAEMSDVMRSAQEEGLIPTGFLWNLGYLRKYSKLINISINQLINIKIGCKSDRL